MWQSLYDLLYGIISVNSSYAWAGYTCEILATCGTIFAFCVPFIVCFKVIKLLLRF